jgi:hypothetical protein
MKYIVYTLVKKEINTIDFSIVPSINASLIVGEM